MQGSKGDICLGILTCPKDEIKLKKFMELYSKELEEKNIPYFLIYADNNLDKYYKLFGRKLYVRTSENYESLAKKLVLFYRFVYEKTDFKYVVKVDCGSTIKIDMIINHPHENYCGGVMKPTMNICHYGKCSNQILNNTPINLTHNLCNRVPKKKCDIKNIKYCGGGYGYILSRKSLKAIINFTPHIMGLRLSYEDVLFGQILFINEILPHNYVFGGYHTVLLE
jgi:hypothetical protein